MDAARVFVIGLYVVLIAVGIVKSSDSTVIEYLLTVKLESWRSEVTHEIKKQVLDDTARSREHQMKYLQNMFLIEKHELLGLKTRMDKLEQENSLLTEIISNLNNKEDEPQCSCIRSATDENKGNSGIRLAVGEHKSGDILVFDTESKARWTLKSPPGILGIAYHPITMMLFTATITDRSAINTINLISGKTERFKPCVHCFSLGIDTRENVLYVIEKVTRRQKYYVVRVPLNRTKNSRLVEYDIKQKPSGIAVDDISRCVFVFLRGGSMIEQIDYTGKKVGAVPLDPLVNDEGITAALTLDKTARVLYYNIGYEIWRKILDSDEDPEYMDTAEWSSPTAMVIFNKTLAVGYWDTRRIELWREEDSFQKWFELGPEGETGSKHMCVLN